MYHPNFTKGSLYAVDSDHVTLDGLSVLATSMGLAFDGASSSLRFAQERDHDRPSCFVWAYHHDDDNADELIKRLKNRLDAMPAVVTYDYLETETAIKLLRAGVFSLLRRPYSHSDLAETVRLAIEHDRKTLKCRERMERVRTAKASLTERQQRVLDFVLDGHPNKLIARRLDVSQRTIEMERAAILRTFGAGNAVELAALVAEYRTRHPESAPHPAHHAPQHSGRHDRNIWSVPMRQSVPGRLTAS